MGTPAGFAAAVTKGQHVSGRELSPMMPRYELRDAELRAIGRLPYLDVPRAHRHGAPSIQNQSPIMMNDDDRMIADAAAAYCKRDPEYRRVRAVRNATASVAF